MGSRTRLTLIGVVLALVVGVVSVRVVRSCWWTSSCDPTVVQVVIGSEKGLFFSEPRVKEVFAKQGLDVRITVKGSREIATWPELTRFDLAFPSSQPAAKKIELDHPRFPSRTPFSSPMVIASFTDIATMLEKIGIARRAADGRWTFDVKQYLDKVGEGEGLRWNQIPGNNTYRTNRNVLVTTTDPRTSNSAAMYVAMVSYVLNKDQVVARADDVADPAKFIGQKLFLNQGFTESTSQDPFDIYMGVDGRARAPMVFAYEAQFLGAQLNNKVGQDMVLMYPTPTVFSDHTFVPLTDKGYQLGELLLTNPELVKLAVEYGFRTPDRTIFREVLTKHNVPVPAPLDNSVPPPTYEILEGFLNEIQQQYQR